MALSTDAGTNVMATLGLAMTLTEYFPDKLWESLKSTTGSYSSTLSLLLAALHSVGFNEESVLAFIVDTIAGEENVTFENAQQKFADLKETVLDSETGAIALAEESEYARLSQQTISKSQTLADLETAVKTAIEAMLAGLFTCSVDPLIPAYAFSETEGFELPLNIIDPTGLLKIAPNSKYGQYSYFDCSSINTLDTSSDFNAFLWYAINRADGEIPWKLSGTTIFYVRYKELTDSICIRLNPDVYKNKRTFTIHIPPTSATTAYTFNKTIYEFNHDYLKTQELYNPSIFVGGLLKAFFDASYSIVDVVGHSNVSLYEKEIEQKISQIIKNIINTDEGTVTDCYYSFSNDEYNTMLETIETERMGGITRNNGTTNVQDADDTNLTENLNLLAESTGNLEEYKTQLTSTITDVLVEQGEEGYIDEEINVTMPSLDSAALFDDLIYNLISTCIRTVISPKVLCLIMINYGAMGLGVPTAEQLLNRLTTILIKIGRIILTKLLDLLYGLFKKYVMPIILKLMTIQFEEQLNNYLELLAELLESCPLAELSSLIATISLGLQKKGLLTQIDDVNYADITPNSNNNDNQKC